MVHYFAADLQRGGLSQLHFEQASPYMALEDR